MKSLLFVTLILYPCYNANSSPACLSQPSPKCLDRVAAELKLSLSHPLRSRDSLFGLDNEKTTLNDVSTESQSAPPVKPSKRPRRTFDGKFLAVISAVLGSTVFEIESSRDCVKVGTCAPILGRSRAQQYGIKLGIAAVVLALTGKFKREDDKAADEADIKGYGGSTKIWWGPATTYSGIFLGRGIYNKARLSN